MPPVIQNAASNDQIYWRRAQTSPACCVKVTGTENRCFDVIFPKYVTSADRIVYQNSVQ